MNKEVVLDKLIKVIKERAREYQNCQNKGTIYYEHYRKLLNELLNIIGKLD